MNAVTGNLGSPSAGIAGKRLLWLLSVLIPATPGVCALLLATTGASFWSFAPLLFFFGVIPILDVAAGEDPYNPTEEQAIALATDGYYRVLLHVAVVVSYASFLACVIVAATTPMSPLAFAALAISVGVASGGGLAIGHELGHKLNRVDQTGAFFMNALSGYGHFKIEHNRGHHSDVATPEDSASARMGESVWRFARREIPGGVARGFKEEARRLSAKGRPFLSVHNEILQSYALTLAIAIALTASFGPKVLPFLLIHHAIAWHQLTFANYVEHYGLLRKKLANGRYEPCAPRHSWNSNHIVSNLSLFHLQRHSDHHAHPLTPYQSLRNFDELPRLPSGYPGCFLLAAVPPLWRSVMDPKVMDWAGGDLANVNVDPAARAALEAKYARAA